MSVGGVAVSALMGEARAEHTITTMTTMVIEAVVIVVVVVVIVVVDDNLGGDGERRRQQHAGRAVDAVCKNSQELRISANGLYQPAPTGRGYAAGVVRTGVLRSAGPLPAARAKASLTL